MSQKSSAAALKHYGKKAPVSVNSYASVSASNVTEDENAGVSSSERAPPGTGNPLATVHENVLMFPEREANANTSNAAAAVPRVNNESRKRKTQQESMEEIIREGHDNDRCYLLKEIEARIANCQSHIAFCSDFVQLPLVKVNGWSPDEVNRLKAWLERLGFNEDLMGPSIIYRYKQTQNVHISELKRLLTHVQSSLNGHFRPIPDASFGGIASSSILSFSQNTRPRIENQLSRSTESLPNSSSSSSSGSGSGSGRYNNGDNDEDSNRLRSYSVDVVQPTGRKSPRFNPNLTIVTNGLGAAGNGPQSVPNSNAQTALLLSLRGPFSTSNGTGNGTSGARGQKQYHFPPRATDFTRQDSEDFYDRSDTPLFSAPTRASSSSALSSPADGQIPRTDSFTATSTSPNTIPAVSSTDSLSGVASFFAGMASPREASLVGLMQNQMKLNSSSKRTSPLMGTFSSGSLGSYSIDSDDRQEIDAKLAEAALVLQHGDNNVIVMAMDSFDSTFMHLTQVGSESGFEESGSGAAGASAESAAAEDQAAEVSDTSTILDTSTDESSGYFSPVISYGLDEDDEPELTKVRVEVGEVPESAIYAASQEEKDSVKAPLLQFASPFTNADGLFVPNNISSPSLGGAGGMIAKPSGVRPSTLHGGLHNQHHVAFSDNTTVFDIPSRSSGGVPSVHQPFMSGSLSSPSISDLAAGDHDAPPPGPGRSSEGGSGSGSGSGSAFGKIARMLSDEELKMHGFAARAPPPQRRSNRNGGAADRGVLRSSQLRRCSTMPSQPTNSLKPEPETPCAMPLSQGDTGNYCTPSRDNTFADAGMGIFDWGDSHPAPVEAISQYWRQLGPLSADRLLSQQRCSSAMGNLENTAFHFGSGGGVGAAGGFGGSMKSGSHISPLMAGITGLSGSGAPQHGHATPDCKLRALDDNSISVCGSGGGVGGVAGGGGHVYGYSGGFSHGTTTAANGLPIFPPAFYLGSQPIAPRRKPVTPVASIVVLNSANKSAAGLVAGSTLMGLKPAFVTYNSVLSLPLPLPIIRRRSQENIFYASSPSSVPTTRLPTASIPTKRSSPYHMDSDASTAAAGGGGGGANRNGRLNANPTATSDPFAVSADNLPPLLALRRSYSNLGKINSADSCCVDNPDEEEQEEGDLFDDDNPVAKSRKIFDSLMCVRERSPVQPEKDCVSAFHTSASNQRLAGPHLMGSMCSPGHALEHDGAKEAKNKELQQKRRQKNSASKMRRMSCSTVTGRQRRVSSCAEAMQGLQALTISEDSEEDSSSLLSPAAKAKAGTGSSGRLRAAAAAAAYFSRRESMDDLDDRMGMLTSGRPSFPSADGDDDQMACSDNGAADGGGGESVVYAMENSYSEDTHKQQTEVGELNEANFSGIIIGGTYQHCFEGTEPVVAPPSSSDKRVVSVTIVGEDSLTLSLYLPMDNQTKSIRLGKSWRWLRASPCGFIVSKGAINARKKVVCYFLPQHPYDWSDRNSRGSNGGSRGSGGGAGVVGHRPSPPPSLLQRFHSRDAGSGPPSPHDSGLSIAMDCSLQHSDITAALNSPADGNAMAVQESSPSSVSSHHPGDSTGLLQSICLQETSFSSSANSSERRMQDTSEIMIFSHLEQDEIDREICMRTTAVETAVADSEAFVDAIIGTANVDWNNSSIVTLVLEFLLGDNVGAGSGSGSGRSATATAGGGGGGGRSKRGGKSTRRTQNEGANREDILSYRAVSKSWALGSYRLLARHLSSSANNVNSRHQDLSYRTWASFVQRHPRGKYLSDGACKTVYCVENAVTDTVEAISVMDVNDLEERGAEASVAQELEISMLCSSLVNLNICANLVQVHTIYRSECRPPEALWKSDPNVDRRAKVGCGNNVVAAAAGSSSSSGGVMSGSAPVTVPKEKDLGEKGCFQYIRMEYCSGGDLEDLVRRADLLDLNSVRSMLFQMIFAMYTCREKLALRHFDIKLLNFFVCEGSSLLPQRRRSDLPRPPAAAAAPSSSSSSACLSSYGTAFCEQGNSDMVNMHVGFGQHIFTLQLLASGLSVVKLADFGTSAVGMATLGDTITEQQFTTLENTPPEYLIAGSACRQAFSADTFPLGLCMLHLLTGKEPYEELLKTVCCPKYLREELRKHWETSDSDSPYYVIGQVMRSLDDSSDDDDGSATDEGSSAPGDVLYNTIYRYLVLFGVSAGLEIGSPSSPWNDNPVWRTILDSLDLISDHGRAYVQAHPIRSAAGGGGGGRKGRAAASSSKAAGNKRDECAKTFACDRQRWNVICGTHELMNCLQGRLNALGEGASRLFENLVHFDPARRSTMHEAILNPLFACYRDPAALFAPSFHSSRPGSSRSPSRQPSLDHIFRDRSSPVFGASSFANDSSLHLMHYHRPSPTTSSSLLGARAGGGGAGEFGGFPFSLSLSQTQQSVGSGADTLPIL